MELHDSHTEHEHASVSLKVVMLVFSLLLVAILGYLVWQQNHATADLGGATILHPKKAATTTTTKATPVVADNGVACGDKAYAFSLTFGDLWKGHKIKEVTPADAIITCYINMPTSSTDSVWTTESTTNFAKYSSLFAVSVYTPTQWTAAQADPEAPTELGHNVNYYWGYSSAQAYPDDLKTVNADVKTVIATFKIN